MTDFERIYSTEEAKAHQAFRDLLGQKNEDDTIFDYAEWESKVVYFRSGDKEFYLEELNYYYGLLSELVIADKVDDGNQRNEIKEIISILEVASINYGATKKDVIEVRFLHLDETRRQELFNNMSLDAFSGLSYSDVKYLTKKFNLQ